MVLQDEMESLLIVVLTFSAVATESHGITSKIGILKDAETVTTLLYLNGNCSWILTFRVGMFPFSEEVSVGPQVQLPTTQDTFEFKCVVNETVQLRAIVTVHDTLPAPENVTLDTASKTLHWDHALQPPDLPADFELTNAINITYLVHMYGKDRANAVTSVNVPVDRLYLNLDDDSIEINSCEEQTFVVQVVANNHSENSSAVSGTVSGVPVFRDFSAHIQVLVGRTRFSIQVIFSFEIEKRCLLVFTVAFHGQDPFRFDVNSTHMENGAAEFTLPLNISDPVMDVCTLRGGRTFASNNAGDSEAADIQFPEDIDCPSVTSSSSSSALVTPTTTATVSSPSPTTPTSPTDTTDPSHSAPTTAIYAASVSAVLCLIIVIALIVGIILVVRKYRRRAMVPKSDYENMQENIQDDGTTVAEQPKIESNVNSHYVEVRPFTIPNEKPALDISKTIYATVDHKKTEELHQQRLEETASAPEPESSRVQEVSIDPKEVGLSLQLHLEPLLAVLAPIKAKWYAIGTHLNLSENFLDETETNIETDEECLSDIMKNWLRYHDPSMKVLNHALSQIDEQPIIFDSCSKEFMAEVERGEEGEGKGEGGGETPPELPEKSS